MKVIRCDKGHFYDSDLYSSCPHCIRELDKDTKAGKSRACSTKKAVGSSGRTDGTKKSSSPKKTGEVKNGFLDSLFKKEKKAGTMPQPQGTAQRPQGDATVFLDAGEVNRAEQEFFGENSNAGNGARPQSGNSGATASQALSGVEIKSGSAEHPEYADCSNRTVDRPEPVDSAGFAQSAEAGFAKSGTAADSDSDRTFGYFAADGTDTQPVVGWLVGLCGPYRGQSFELKSGGNTIGRAAGNSVVLFGDHRVSRRAHAILIYEPRGRSFYIQSGTGSGLTYVNGEVILHQSALNGGEKIEIGGGSYLFVPLCSSAFSWESYPEFQPICREGIQSGSDAK